MSLLASALAVRRLTGKSLFRQFLEAARLRLRPSPIGFSEYFDYGIWDAALDEEQQRRFIGWRESQVLDRKLNDQHSRVLANDKLITYQLLSQQGLPIPRPLATYSATGRRIAEETTLHSADELRDYLLSAPYPFFVKPIAAGYGRGALAVSAFRDGLIELCDGDRITFADFFSPFTFPPFHGMLLQECLTAHPDLQRLTGSRFISCARLICLIVDGRCQIHTAFLKVITGRNILDNFSHGDYGNCLARIEPTTGILTHAISHLGPGGEITHHPTTGEPLPGFSLPDWQEVIRLVMEASRLFPGLRLQNWDVACTDRGPVLIELNTESELAVPQAISRRGLKDGRLKALLARCAAEDAAMLAAKKSGAERFGRLHASFFRR